MKPALPPGGGGCSWVHCSMPADSRCSMDVHERSLTSFNHLSGDEFPAPEQGRELQASLWPVPIPGPQPSSVLQGEPQNLHSCHVLALVMRHPGPNDTPATGPADTLRPSGLYRSLWPSAAHSEPAAGLAPRRRAQRQLFPAAGAPAAGGGRPAPGRRVATCACGPGCRQPACVECIVQCNLGKDRVK